MTIFSTKTQVPQGCDLAKDQTTRLLLSAHNSYEEKESHAMRKMRNLMRGGSIFNVLC